MKKYIKTIIPFYLLSFVLLLGSCSQDEIPMFEGSNGITFLPDTESAAVNSYEKSYSFLGNSTGEFVQEVEVQIVGEASDTDRYFNVRVVTGDDTTATENQYEIIEGVVKANEYQGKLYVKLYNSAALDDTIVSISIELVDSPDFKIAAKETNSYKLEWTNKVLIPNWRYYSFFFTTKASTLAYRLVVQTTGLKVFTATDYRTIGADGVAVLATKFGDYVKQWNLDHPNDPLIHDDGDLEGQEIQPRYYTKSKYD